MADCTYTHGLNDRGMTGIHRWAWGIGASRLMKKIGFGAAFSSLVFACLTTVGGREELPPLERQVSHRKLETHTSKLREEG